MNHDDPMLEQLLREAGRATEPPVDLPADLAGRVRDLHRRRRVRAAAATAVGVAVLLVSVPVYRYFGPDRDRSIVDAHATADDDAPHRSPRGDNVDDNAAEIARLQRELLQIRAELHAKESAVRPALDAWRRGNQRAALRRELSKPDPWQLAHVEIEKTAFLLVDHVDRQDREALLPDARQAAYRQVVELFPETHWGAVAQSRLREPPNQGDM
ncbi:MAG: hypothetical protein HQ567_22780 [Candidatus Nealsonbacteria bacterium]|nr:hypothetical protein [Candidatus Nealsonbacteria bacterium]